MFVCFEGIDGAGKSTQARLLYERLKADGVPVEQVADPGTTHIGTAIRQILLYNDAPISREAQMLLFSAARAELASYIRERLAAGVTVICDRWLLSTLVYQGELNGIDPEFILSVFNQTSKLSPDLSFVLDLPPERSPERTGPGRDRYERVDNETRQRMRDAYLRFSSSAAKRYQPKQYCVLNAEAPIDETHEEVYRHYQLLRDAHKVEATV